MTTCRKLLLITLLLLSGGARGDAAGAMADFIWTMMRAMADIVNRVDGDADLPEFALGWGSPGPGFGSPGRPPSAPAIPWGPGNSWSQGVPTLPWSPSWPAAPRGMQPPSRSAPARARAPHPAWLNGVWEGAAGDYLLIYRGLYRIVVGPGEYVEGWVAAGGNRIRFKTHVGVHDYDFAYSDGRLALRDASGRLLLYRHLRERR